MLPAVAKITDKIIMECIKEEIESFIDWDQIGLRSGSSCSHHVNSLGIIVKQYIAFIFILSVFFLNG